MAGGALNRRRPTGPEGIDPWRPSVPQCHFAPWPGPGRVLSCSQIRWGPRAEALRLARRGTRNPQQVSGRLGPVCTARGYLGEDIWGDSSARGLGNPDGEAQGWEGTADCPAFFQGLSQVLEFIPTVTVAPCMEQSTQPACHLTTHGARGPGSIPSTRQVQHGRHHSPELRGCGAVPQCLPLSPSVYRD